jgi:hypothetical protein
MLTIASPFLPSGRPRSADSTVVIGPPSGAGERARGGPGSAAQPHF